MNWSRSTLHLAASIIGAMALSACAATHLTNISLELEGAPASPEVLGEFEGAGPVVNSAQWLDERVPILREAFQREFYGYQPDTFETLTEGETRLDENLYDGLATLDFVKLKIRSKFGDGEWKEQSIRLLLAKPKTAEGPIPTILKMDFCPSTQVFQSDKLPDEGWSCGAKGFSPINRAVWSSLGRYHISPPIEEMLQKGYAYASIHVGDYVPDSRSRGPERLVELSDGAEPGQAWGSLAAWAFQFSRAIDYLDQDTDLDPTKTAVYGHSRYGKSALVAGAFDARIDAVIAHQSGRGGAALTRSTIGEPMAEMVSTYPAWLSKSYANRIQSGEQIELPIDQHHLVAMNAPHPVLLGHSRRDRWSDPQGAFRAAQGASPAYKLFNRDGFRATNLKDFDPSADIAFWLRGGTHGETAEDWTAFFAFLDAHFAPVAKIEN